MLDDLGSRSLSVILKLEIFVRQVESRQVAKATISDRKNLDRAARCGGSGLYPAIPHHYTLDRTLDILTLVDSHSERLLLRQRLCLQQAIANANESIDSADGILELVIGFDRCV
jgi:hypothetical protein